MRVDQDNSGLFHLRNWKSLIKRRAELAEEPRWKGENENQIPKVNIRQPPASP